MTRLSAPMTHTNNLLSALDEVTSLQAASWLSPHPKHALAVLRNTLDAVHITAVAGLWGVPGREMLHRSLSRVLQLLTEGVPIDELIARSSLGTPEVTQARAKVDPDAVRRVLLRSQELSQQFKCPACQQDFKTQDHDPFCSSCVEAGWDAAWIRGYAAARAARNEAGT